MHNQDPIEVGFTGGFHHPLLHYKNDNGDFVKRFSKYRKAGLVPSPAAVKIPALARIGRGHPTLLNRAGIPVMDPAQKAIRLRSEYCPEV
ncbi:MAG: hypothetical protein QXY22_03800 [Candidatus Nitrosotenuis sp.]